MHAAGAGLAPRAYGRACFHAHDLRQPLPLPRGADSPDAVRQQDTAPSSSHSRRLHTLLYDLLRFRT